MKQDGDGGFWVTVPEYMHEFDADDLCVHCCIDMGLGRKQPCMRWVPFPWWRRLLRAAGLRI